MKEQLENKVWWTRKSHIEAEKRMRFRLAWSHVFLFNCSFCALALSIIGLEAPDRNLSLASVLISVFVCMCTVQLCNQKYAYRAEDHKKCYLDLAKILPLIQNTDEKDLTTLENLNERYVNILNETENHHDIDYLSAKWPLRKDKTSCPEGMSGSHILMFIGYKTAEYAIIITPNALAIYLVIYCYFLDK
jgi:hypothetical protein